MDFHGHGLNGSAAGSPPMHHSIAAWGNAVIRPRRDWTTLVVGGRAAPMAPRIPRSSVGGESVQE